MVKRKAKELFQSKGPPLNATPSRQARSLLVRRSLELNEGYLAKLATTG